MAPSRLVLPLALLALAACGGSGGEESRLPAPDPGLFADRAVALWLGADYTAGGDGTSGIDGAGTVASTLREMGYALPPVTADGLHANYHTVEGVDRPGAYTVESGASDADLADGVYDDLARGDLVFLDYDLDGTWDHVAVYLGAHAPFAHAALTASDYYDEVVVADLDDPDEPLRQDLEWSSVSSRALDVAGIAALQ